MALRLDKKMSEVSVDTPERWQGLECKVMVMVHPLSGVVRPSAFDLETGRLCVMASRHKAGLLVVTRDHLERRARPSEVVRHEVAHLLSYGWGSYEPFKSE